MKYLIRAAFTVISLLSITAAQAHHRQSTTQSDTNGGYDNTGRGPHQTGMEGGGE